MGPFKKILAGYFKVFLIVYVVNFFIALLLYYTLPRKYTATAEIMPSLDQEILVTLGSALANFNPLVSMMVTPADIYTKIIQSRAVLYELIDSLDLQKKFKVKSKILAYRRLLKALEVKPYSEGIIEISYEDKDKEFATNLVNAVVRILDNFNRKTIMTKGKDLRLFLEERLAEEEHLIETLRDSLKVLQKKYNAIQPESEYMMLLEGYFNIYKEYSIRRAEFSYLKKIYGENNPLLSIKEKELEAYEKELKKIIRDAENPGNPEKIFNISQKELPEVMAKFLDIMLKLEAHQEVYKFLFTKYEEAKLLEKKDTPTFTVMRWAEIPDHKSFPRGTHLVILFFIFATMINIIIFIVGELPEAHEILVTIFRK
ncbi:MAG: hypothetical protein ABIM44_02415 [candidate division WOR-3 bacterium]